MGQVVYQIKNQSLWLDALDDARLDDVDAWHLGLHDGPTSRYTSGWDKSNARALKEPQKSLKRALIEP
jgi:hypothetical protein